MAKERVPKAVVNRLPGYHRYLSMLEKMGFVRISSKQLGDRMGLTASQIRQDINCFGGFGQQGYGYNVAELRSRIGDILGVGKGFHMIVIGAGNIGKAISNYSEFREMGYTVDAAFDSNPPDSGFLRSGTPVYDIKELETYLASNPVDIGVIAVPSQAAQKTADRLVAAGVCAIWNFAPTDIIVPESVSINSVHLLDALLVLSYHMNNRLEKAEDE